MGPEAGRLLCEAPARLASTHSCSLPRSRPQPPQLQPVVSIAYIPVDAQTLGRARAALIAGDTSGRALHAAAAAIAVNPADYGAWRLRWTCIEKAAERGIEKAAERARESGGQQAERGVWLEELALVECMAGDIPKNYQVSAACRKGPDVPSAAA